MASFNDEVIEIFGQFPANIIACRFFDQEFDVSHVSTDYFGKISFFGKSSFGPSDEYSEDIDDPRHWMNIPTTAIVKSKPFYFLLNSVLRTKFSTFKRSLLQKRCGFTFFSDECLQKLLHLIIGKLDLLSLVQPELER